MKHLLELGSRRYTPNLKMYTGLPCVSSAIVLLDILVITALFFTRSGNYSSLSGFRVEVPRIKTSFKENVLCLPRNVVSIMPSEKKGKPFELFFMNKPAELEDLLSELEKQRAQIRTDREDGESRHRGPDISVIVMVDRSITFDQVAPTLAAIGNAGFKCYLPVMPQTESKDQSFEQ